MVFGNEKLSDSALQSLAVQLRWLSQRLEIHLLGNHLFLMQKHWFGGLFFEGSEAKEWLAKGLKILNREVQEQILSDGGHFELSTMYHALAFEDMLDLLNITESYQLKLRTSQKNQVYSWNRSAQLMARWLNNMCHPDGEISLFNDSALDIACSTEELNSYAERILPQTYEKVDNSIFLMGESGYIRMSDGPATVILDVGEIGPHYLPAHAHADTLSFEFSIGTQRVFTNSGTSCYGNSKKRLYQRSTEAHNTVVIDGESSSEVWKSFRVARRAHLLI